MIAPTQPLAGETSSHCSRLTAAVSSSPHQGPNRNVPIRIGTSAMSYSRYAADGKIGKWIRNTSRIDSAVSMPSLTSRLVVWLVVMGFMDVGSSFWPDVFAAGSRPPPPHNKRPAVQRDDGARDKRPAASPVRTVTVGAGISPARPWHAGHGSRTVTAGGELHPALKHGSHYSTHARAVQRVSGCGVRKNIFFHMPFGGLTGGGI